MLFIDAFFCVLIVKPLKNSDVSIYTCPQTVAKVFMTPLKLMFASNARGCRLAWSRLVDLGSIDSGSNPGSPIKGSEPVPDCVKTAD